MSKDKETIRHLIRAGMGEVESDLVVTGARLVNVYSGEVLDGMEVAASRGIPGCWGSARWFPGCG